MRVAIRLGDHCGACLLAWLHVSEVIFLAGESHCMRISRLRQAKADGSTHAVQCSRAEQIHGHGGQCDQAAAGPVGGGQRRCTPAPAPVGAARVPPGDLCNHMHRAWTHALQGFQNGCLCGDTGSRHAVEPWQLSLLPGKAETMMHFPAPCRWQMCTHRAADFGQVAEPATADLPSPLHRCPHKAAFALPVHESAGQHQYKPLLHHH